MLPPHPSIPDPALQFWNERYSAPDFFYGTEPNRWLASQASRLWNVGDRILAVADGEGRNGVWLAEQGFQVDSFDASPVAVAKAQALAAARGVTLRQEVATVDSFSWPESVYDGVVGIFIQFAGPGLRHRLFQAMVRSLKPGGVLLLLGYTPEQIELGTGGPSDPAYLYTEPLLREAFQDLTLETLETLNATLSEGGGHNGPSALIRLVARVPEKVATP